MTQAEEELVKMYGPNPAYNSTVYSYPVGLCSSCRRALYKIRAGQTIKSWCGPQPPTWAKFNIEAIFGTRKCGSLNQNGDKMECDMCKHIKFNPIGSSLPKHVINKGQVLLPHGKEETQAKKRK